MLTVLALCEAGHKRWRRGGWSFFVFAEHRRVRFDTPSHV